ncbi:MAG: tetratricopeptide repeat protein, partial [Paraglaciecola sp.]
MNNVVISPKVLILFVNLFLLCACQTIPHKDFTVDVPKPFDQGFNTKELLQVESEEQIFQLNKSSKAFVRQMITSERNPISKMESLVYGVFGRSNMNLLYRGDANTVASETFKNRAANCLSMSIMMHALAKEAGFQVSFQEVEIPEYWTRRQGYSLLNGHINLRMSVKNTNTSFVFQTRSYQVDFDPQPSRNNFPKKIVSKRHVIAMFYNNKG